MTVPDQRSPAFQGARLAFSSPPASSVVRQSPSNTTHSGSRGALAAASSAEKHNRSTLGNDDLTYRKLVNKRNSSTSPQQHGNQATSSYIAANRAARTSTERLPTPTAVPLLQTPRRPSPLRSQSDLSGNANTDGPSINALIKRYEGEHSQLSMSARPHNLPGKRTHSLNTIGNRLGSHSLRPAASQNSFESQQSFARPRTPSSSTESSYTSAADEPTIQQDLSPTPDIAPSLRPPPEHHPGPLKHSDRRTSNTSVNHVRRIEPTLSNSVIPQLSADSLADAMVASSLASSRAPSPTRPPLPPPRRRSRPHLFHRTHSAEESGSRTPSPSKGYLRQTMRAPLDPNEAETPAMGKHKGKRFINKHPNKHHEGDRKRWRDQITELERKRYEGVWAANRGLLTSTYRPPPPSSSSSSASSPPIDLANSVLNLVVRDIWSRSNLPSDVLEETWELVNSHGTALLSKEEFVVGMWLLDQRLKGRKLPGKVSDSVWFSARGLTGVKVRGRH